MSDKILHPTIYKDENIEIFLEIYDKEGWGLFAHCYVTNWSKELFKDFQEIWDSILDNLLLRGYDKIHVYIPTSDMKIIRFVSLFGFQPIGTFLKDSEGIEREIYTCLT